MFSEYNFFVEPNCFILIHKLSLIQLLFLAYDATAMFIFNFWESTSYVSFLQIKRETLLLLATLHRKGKLFQWLQVSFCSYKESQKPSFILFHVVLIRLKARDSQVKISPSTITSSNRTLKHFSFSCKQLLWIG